MKSWIRLAAAAIVLLATACSQPQAGKSENGAVKIRFVTDWRAQAEQGGFYQALATGEYAKRGLDVSIIQGGPGVNVPQLLAAGSAEMGMGSNSFIALNLVREGVPIKVVAATLQKDPQVLMAHPGQGIDELADMRGRPIFLSDASVTAFWVWLKAKYGFTDAQVRSYTNSAPFLADRRAIQQGYLTSEPYTIEKTAGMRPQVFLLADEGYPSYAGMVLASDAFIAANPDAVRAFVEATAAGWTSYLHGDPRPGDALIRRDNPEMTQDLLNQAREKMRQYGIVESGEAAGGRIGAMSDARWAEFFKVASEQGVYPADLDYKAAYTLQFLPQPAAQ